MSQYWMLPEDVIELLPENAIHIERLRRQFLDNSALWGYQLVMPPLVEFLDSLLVGSEDLDLQTFKLTDQQSGRMMGVRADITPQIARIDAHRLPTDAVSRFAYCGGVLRTRSESTQPRRNPLIAGAELYGVKGMSGDVEVMALLLDTITQLGIEKSVLDISHSGIFAGLVAVHDLDNEQRKEIKEVITGLRRPDLRHWQQNGQFSPQCIDDIEFLIDAPLVTNEIEALEKQFSGRHKYFDRAIIDLKMAENYLQIYFPKQKISIDISSVGTYGYHSGLLFALYVDGHYDAIARGGRYDDLGAVYGRARPASGFSIDLLTLGQILPIFNAKQSSDTQSLPVDAEVFQQVLRKRHNGTTVYFKHED